MEPQSHCLDVSFNFGPASPIGPDQTKTGPWWDPVSMSVLAPTADVRTSPEFDQRDSEPPIHKQYGDSFEVTDLEAVLAERKIGRLIVTGAQTDGYLGSTLPGAIVRGYDSLLVDDAHTTEDLSASGAPSPDEVIDHTNLYCKFHTEPGREAGTVSTKAVTFSWTHPPTTDGRTVQSLNPSGAGHCGSAARRRGAAASKIASAAQHPSSSAHPYGLALSA
jgi:hypothetical protein